MNKIDGRYLKEMREARGLSLREFALKIYVSKSTVQRWEKSFVPENEDVLDKISQLFGVSVENMRIQSSAKYGEIAEQTERRENNNLSARERAEAEFGIKGLIIVASAIGVALVVMILLLTLM